MRDVEHRALLRAAVLLLGISVLRWSAAVGRSDPAASMAGGSNALPAHQAATAAALSEAEERARPLTEGERIDPNAADEAQLDRLPGIGPATAQAIITARDSGIVFRQADDLLRVRGIGPSTLERIRPWVRAESMRRLHARPADRRSPSGGGREPADSGGGVLQRRGPIDVNRAGVSALQTLPGIGPALAGRILAERTVRPFDSLDDLLRVRGIGPSTLSRLRSHVTVGSRR
ncbi:MAG: helix-hairpin-helix domain-containing protein [Gemmatimonadetes bacterium]|nr:helix-hairpin-helix domain-containing protein [Gemmatimonadota bacterium]